MYAVDDRYSSAMLPNCRLLDFGSKRREAVVCQGNFVRAEYEGRNLVLVDCQREGSTSDSI